MISHQGTLVSSFVNISVYFNRLANNFMELLNRFFKRIKVLLAILIQNENSVVNIWGGSSPPSPPRPVRLWRSRQQFLGPFYCGSSLSRVIVVIAVKELSSCFRLWCFQKLKIFSVFWWPNVSLVFNAIYYFFICININLKCNKFEVKGKTERY